MLTQADFHRAIREDIARELPVRYFDESWQHVLGQVFHNGTCYVGTTQGLYRIDAFWSYIRLLTKVIYASHPRA
jgi:hypothetical protein